MAAGLQACRNWDRTGGLFPLGEGYANAKPAEVARLDSCSPRPIRSIVNPEGGPSVDRRAFLIEIATAVDELQNSGSRATSGALHICDLDRLYSVNHCEDSVAIAFGIVESFQHHGPGTILGAAITRVGGELDRTGQGSINFMFLQSLDRERDCPQSAGFFIAHGKTRPAGTEEASDSAGRDAGERAHRSIGRECRMNLILQGLIDFTGFPAEEIVGRVRIEADADEDAQSLPLSTLGRERGRARIHRLSRDLQHQCLLRQHFREFSGRDAKAGNGDRQ